MLLSSMAHCKHLARLPLIKPRQQIPQFLTGKAIYLKENDVFGKETMKLV